MTKDDLKKIKELAEAVIDVVSAITPDDAEEVRVDCNSTENVLEKYISAFSGGKHTFALDSDEGKVIERMCWYHRTAVNPFAAYLSKDFADYAAVAKKFLDACLAFKWCHDAEYNPDWDNSKETKWYLVWDYGVSRFVVFHTQSFQALSTVYYSSRDIAQTCADWLNYFFFQQPED